MRIGLALLLAAAPVLAADAARVQMLVERLREPLTHQRRAAFAELRELGEEIVPLLEKMRTDDPEVARLLRALTRSARKLRLLATAPARRQPLGSPLILDVNLANDTDDEFVLPLVQNSKRRAGTQSCFFVRLGEGKPFYLYPDQVDAKTEFSGRMPKVGAGETFRLQLRLDGLKSPLRRPGVTEITVYYGTRGAKRDGDPRRLLLEAKPVTIEAYGRKPAVLEAALKGKDKKARASALRELEVRADPAILPVLRRNVDDPDLRVAAITRLGANADDEDLRLIRKAAGDPRAEVRVAAVKALGNYRSSRARRKLCLLARTDQELVAAAVEALTKYNHRHAETIECFIYLLKRHEAPWTAQVRDALFDWTGQFVQTRLKDVEAFEVWWLNNSDEWMARNQRNR